MEDEQVPGSWVGQRVRIITIVTADRTAQEEATLLNLDQVGITVSREELVGGREEIVFHPWTMSTNSGRWWADHSTHRSRAMTRASTYSPLRKANRL